GVSILEVHGRLTIGEPSEQLYAALQSVVKKGARKVIVALNSTPQIDSSGLSTLVRISIQLARDGGVLRLVCGPGRVRDALTVTRLVEAIPTFETESAALANFACACVHATNQLEFQEEGLLQNMSRVLLKAVFDQFLFRYGSPLLASLGSGT